MNISIVTAESGGIAEVQIGDAGTDDLRHIVECLLCPSLERETPRKPSVVPEAIFGTLRQIHEKLVAPDQIYHKTRIGIAEMVTEVISILEGIEWPGYIPGDEDK